MLFTATPLAGAHLIDIEPLPDERGFFARTWCTHELAEHGLDTAVAQCSISFNHRRGTLRGMHYQIAPHAEVKLVRCTAGAIYDVIIDLRRESATYLQWYGAELSARNHRTLYIPKGFAHGFLTLADDTEVAYAISEPYTPGAAAGVRYDDPLFGIEWPAEVRVIAERDANYPDYPHYPDYRA